MILARRKAAWYLGWDIVEHGGPGSGNWGHASVKGRRGGSAPKSGPGAMMSLSTGFDWQARQQFAKTGEVTGALVRGAITRQHRESVLKIDRTRKRGYAKNKEMNAYHKKHITPLFKKRVELMTAGKAKTPEYKAVMEEIEQHQKKTAAMFDEHIKIMNDLRAMKDGLKKSALEMLEVPKDKQAQVTLDFGKLRKGKKEAEKGLDIFNRLVGTGSVNGESVEVIRTKKSRAYYDQFGTGGLALSTTNSARTVLHEMGHWLEDRDATVHQKAIDFLAQRTKGESAKWLGAIQPGSGYKKYETSKADDFLHPYMGKVYQSKHYGQYATEIVSMGLEYMYSKPIEFAKKDPEYFDFMFALLRGK